MLSRRHLIALPLAQALGTNLFVQAGRAQTLNYPSRPVRVIVPVAAGGPTDIVARLLAEKLSKMWGQQVFIENKGGAGTNLGNEEAARSDPDGHTIPFGTASLAVNTSLYRSLSYDPLTDQIRSWTFDSRGGYGEALWTRQGNSWVAETAGVLPGGQTGSAVNVIRYVDDNTFVFQARDRQVGGEPIPDAEVRLVRKSAK